MVSESTQPGGPEFQSLENVPLVQLPREAGEAEGAIRVAVFEGDTLRQTADRLSQQIVNKYWWLNPEWRKKGPPKERVDLTINDQTFSTFNFGSELSAGEIEALRLMVAVMSQIPNNYTFTNILINDEDKTNNYTGQNMLGEGYPEARAFEVSLRARKEQQFRGQPGVSAFLGTVLHESAHSFVNNGYDVSTINAWIKELNWRFIPAESTTRTVGGFPQSYLPDDPAKCVSEYAAFAPNEDFCESFVAALLFPERLDPDRLRFIEERFGIPGIDLGKSGLVDVQRKSYPDYEMPRIEEVRFYTVNFPRINTLFGGHPVQQVQGDEFKG